MLSMSFRLVSFCLLALISCDLAYSADPQPAGSAPSLQVPNLQPLLVCPPKYNTPIFVPADELLQQAEQSQPVTDEGWIVQRRPVGDCVNCVADPQTRKYQLLEQPLELRQYNTAVRLLQAEIASWQRRLVNYEYFNKAGALPVTVENTRLHLHYLQERLRNLQYEHMLRLRYHNVERELSQGIPVELP